jgi:hypothetical protein
MFITYLHDVVMQAHALFNKTLNEKTERKKLFIKV